MKRLRPSGSRVQAFRLSHWHPLGKDRLLRLNGICHEQYIPKALYRDQAYRRDARVLPHTRRPGMVGTRPTENVIARICELLDLAARLRSASAQWIRG